MPSAILFDGTATPPVPGGEYAIQHFKLKHCRNFIAEEKVAESVDFCP
jgi:hypothetical protein